MLGLLPGGTELTQARAGEADASCAGPARSSSHAWASGSCSPSSGLNYRIAWPGRPTPGTYRVVGTIRPQGSAVININQTIGFTAAKAAQLKREAPPVAGAPAAHSGTPIWVWIALAVGAAVVIALSIAVWKLTRRPRGALT